MVNTAYHPDQTRWPRSATPILRALRAFAENSRGKLTGGLGGGTIWKGAHVFHPAIHAGWDTIPTGRVSLDAGDAWAAGLGSALLMVPSGIVPEDTNILINPTHPDAAKLRARTIRRWTYDARFA